MSNNVELVQNIKARELTAKIRMLKQMLRLFEKRHANLFQNKIHCCSWEVNCKQNFGFIWAYSTTRKSDIVFPGNTYQHGCKQQVCQLTLNGKIIATHESISRGAKSVGIRPGAISKVLRGEQKLAGGYKWAYADAA